MEPQPLSAHPRPDSISANRILPRIELRQISAIGMVIRASETMQPGTALALGVHLPGAGHRRRFMDFEGIVVDCRRITDVENALSWEVTLMFPHLTPAQTRALRTAARAMAQPAAKVPALPSGGAFAYGEREFSAWCGMN